MRRAVALLSLFVVLAVTGCGAPAPMPTIAVPAPSRPPLTVAVAPAPAATPAALATAPLPTVTITPPSQGVATPAPVQAATPAALSTAPPPSLTVPPPSQRPATPTPAPAALPVTPVVEVFAGGLDTPWAIDFAPNGRIFLTERRGVIRIIKDGSLQAEPWMTVPGVVEVGEAGLLGLAIDPQFAGNGFVYVAHTYRAGDGKLMNQLVRLREDSSGKGVLDMVLLSGVAGNSTHDGGRVKIGPDGKIYWTMGDAQNTAAAQDVRSLSGKILRLNTDGSIPSDNPFPGSPVYSYGHRNPQGLAWQPGSNRLYATEHGPSGGQGCCRDEVNLIEPGKNYGWPAATGDDVQAGTVSPVRHSGDGDTWAPSGATFVTGGPWAGSLLFVGLRGQSLYRMELDGRDARHVASFTALYSRQFGRLRDVVQGPDGALYVLSSNLDGRGAAGPDGDVVLRVSFR